MDARKERFWSVWENGTRIPRRNPKYESAPLSSIVAEPQGDRKRKVWIGLCGIAGAALRRTAENLSLWSEPGNG